MAKSLKKHYLVPAIKRGFDVIDLLAERHEGLTLSEIHRELRLPLSSAAAIVYTLQSLAYLDKNEENGRYTLGAKTYTFSNRGMDQNEIVRRCHSLVEQLASESGLTTHIAIKHQQESLYIDRAPAPGLMQISSYIGMRWPLHASGVGKALLFSLPEEELQDTVKHLLLQRVTKYTISSKGALLKQLAHFRKLGYGWEINEGELGIGCVAAPIFDDRNRAIAAISVTGSTHQVNEENIPSRGQQVKKFADLMSKRMGTSSLK